MKLINDVITHLLDPNLYYSRFSFLESGMEAINIKYDVSLLTFFLKLIFRKQKRLLCQKSETNFILEVP